jgi:hypothetical protein
MPTEVLYIDLSHVELFRAHVLLIGKVTIRARRGEHLFGEDEDLVRIPDGKNLPTVS